MIYDEGDIPDESRNRFGSRPPHPGEKVFKVTIMTHREFEKFIEDSLNTMNAAMRITLPKEVQ